jgi:hypothetical protein
VSLQTSGVPSKTGGFALKSAKSANLQHSPVLAWTAAICRRFLSADMSAHAKLFAAIPNIQHSTFNIQQPIKP